MISLKLRLRKQRYWRLQCYIKAKIKVTLTINEQYKVIKRFVETYLKYMYISLYDTKQHEYLFIVLCYVKFVILIVVFNTHVICNECW